MALDLNLFHQVHTPGPNFCMGDKYWKVPCKKDCTKEDCAACKRDTIPRLATFIIGSGCFLIFEVFGFNKSDVKQFLEDDVKNWNENEVFMFMFEAITQMNVVNDPSERSVWYLYRLLCLVPLVPGRCMPCTAWCSRCLVCLVFGVWCA